MQTCCPACQTCFRITRDQLAMAQGKVRCGKCKTVFNAREHLQEPKAQTGASQTKSGTTRPAAAPLAPARAEQSAKPAEPAREPAAPAPARPTAPRPREPVAADPASSKAASIAGLDTNLDSPDLSSLDLSSLDLSSLDLSSLDTQDLEIPAAAEPGSPAPASDERFSDDDFLFADEVEPTPAPVESDASYADRGYFDDQDIERNLDDILAEMNHQLAMAIDSPQPDIGEDFSLPLEEAPARRENDADELDASIERIFEDITPDDITPDEDFAAGAGPAATAEDQPRQELDAISRELDFVEAASPASTAPGGAEEFIPLRLRDSLQIQPPRPRSKLAWLGGILLLLVLPGGAALQLAVFRPMEVSRLAPALQPYLLQVCERLPCQFHYQRDLARIQLLSRDVRAHPREPEALLITAAMVNNADFSQAYPDIEVSLFDLSGNVAARRRFVPADYMGELNSPFLLMNPGTPVQISLEVLDPGNDAINFAFDFK